MAKNLNCFTFTSNGALTDALFASNFTNTTRAYRES